MVMIGLLETGSQDLGMDEHWGDPRTTGKLQAYATNHQQGSFPQDSRQAKEEGVITDQIQQRMAIRMPQLSRQPREAEEEGGDGMMQTGRTSSIREKGRGPAVRSRVSD